MTQQNDSQRCIGFALVLAATMFLTGCAPGSTLDLFDGPQREDEVVATIVPMGGCKWCVKEIRPAAAQTPIYTFPVREVFFFNPDVPGKFRVPPGRYKLTLYEPGGGGRDAAKWAGYVDLNYGHSYHVHRYFCILCWSDVTWIWMEEAITGEVLLGFRTPQNDIETAEWVRLHAQRGNTSYQYSMGSIYEEGRGVPQNYVLAYMWYTLALPGWSGSVHWPNEYAEGREQVAAKMTPEQISEAQRLVKQWKPNQLVLDEKMTPEQISEAQRLLRQWNLKTKRLARKN